jgi:hypothetical protein
MARRCLSKYSCVYSGGLRLEETINHRIHTISLPRNGISPLTTQSRRGCKPGHTKTTLSLHACQEYGGMFFNDQFLTTAS